MNVGENRFGVGRRLAPRPYHGISPCLVGMAPERSRSGGTLELDKIAWGGVQACTVFVVDPIRELVVPRGISPTVPTTLIALLVRRLTYPAVFLRLFQELGRVR